MPDFDEPAEYADLRAAVRKISADHGHAEFAAYGARNEPQLELWADLAAAGFIGINIPTEYGGGGAGLTELVLVAEESAGTGSPLLLLLVSSAISVEILARHGSADQKQEWLPRLAAGEKMAFAITEPDAGSNSHRHHHQGPARR